MKSKITNEVIPQSWERIQANWKLNGFIYLLTLAISLIPGILFWGILKKSIGNSMALEALMPDFKYMIFSDFMRENANNFKPVLRISALIGFLYSIIYTFLAGGVIDQLANPKIPFSFSRFFKNSTKYFSRYFVLLIFTGLLLFSLFLISGVFFFLFILFAEGSTERGYFFWLLSPAILLFTFICFGLVVSFYAKTFLYQNAQFKVTEAFWKSFSYVFYHPKSILLFLMTLFIGFLLLLVYLLLDKYIGMKSSFTVAILVCIQQVFIFSRIILKHWNYALAIDFVELYPIDLTSKKEKLAALLTEEPDEITMTQPDESQEPEGDNEASTEKPENFL